MRFAKLIERYPLASYFIITFGISWLGALLFLSPKLLRGQPIPKTISTGIILGTFWGV